MNTTHEKSFTQGQGEMSLVAKALEVNKSLVQSKQNAIWFAVNIVAVGVLWNLWLTIDENSWQGNLLWYGKAGLIVFLSINALSHFVNYVRVTCLFTPVPVSPAQKKLLGIGRTTEKWFEHPRTPPQQSQPSTESTPKFSASSPMNFATTSWLSSPSANESAWNQSKYSIALKRILPCCKSPPKKNNTQPRPSYRFFSGGNRKKSQPLPEDKVKIIMAQPPSHIGNFTTAAMLSPNYTQGSPVYQQPPYMRPHLYPRSADEDIIRDELSLSRYLAEVAEFERQSAVSAAVEHGHNSSFSPFWNSLGPRSMTADVSPLLRRCAYQMSSVSPIQPSMSPGGAPEESGSPSSPLNNAELWRRFKIDPSLLTQWNANLRMWISLTVLERLVKEFDFIDEAFLRSGLSDLHLGSVGLDRLKKTASIPQVVASVPSLPRLVLFLELSPHQEYLVNRVRELAKGGSMSEFRWNSGGSLNGKNWEEHLPTDAALVMHLIATYLDLQLLPLPHRPDTRPFSSQYLVRSPEKPPRSGNSPIIYQSQLNPPHFVVVDKDEYLDVPKGRNNLLYALLLFLNILKNREHGMLGPVNLGRSGVNILWVIDS